MISLIMSHESIAQAGLIVRLDTDALRTAGGCQTNAVKNAQGDRAVRGTHDFLLVYVDASENMTTAVPLFSKSAVGNQPLVESLKSGAGEGWIGADVYFSRWQHWRIPTLLINEALQAHRTARNDANLTAAPNDRRYAANDSSALDDVRVWESHNRAQYRDA